MYVIVVSLDFSKAFDSIRCTLLHKISELDLPDHADNWLVNYFSGHSHCTSFRGQTSSLLDITASIIQGSAIGPASYVINTGHLAAITPSNSLCKVVDDTYLIVPAVNQTSRLAELNHIGEGESPQTQSGEIGRSRVRRQPTPTEEAT